MITVDRLKELIAVYGFLVTATLPLDDDQVEINKEYADVLSVLEDALKARTE